MAIRPVGGLSKSKFLVLIGALVGVCLSSYPIIFLGKSHFSPGYQIPLIYSGAPYFPGYESLDTEQLSADHGAGPWQNLPYSRIQYKSIFLDNEFPFWNRYNSAGLPLFGQGQSQILDPIHWITVFSKGNSWGWDAKFLLSKLIFLIGLGLVLCQITKNRMVVFALVLSSAFIGFNYFRFNHPAFFNLTYAPWVFLFYLQLVRNLQRGLSDGETVFRQWADWPSVGIVISSALVFFSGTPKEVFILLCALHFSGLLGILGIRRTSGETLLNVVFLGALWFLFALVTTPHWLIFFDTLGKLSNIYSEPYCYFSHSPLQFVDAFFLGSHNRPWSWPTVNVFIAGAAVSAFVVLARLWKEPGFRMALVPLICLLALANGMVPAPWCEKIPLIGKIHHLYDVCFAAAVVFAVVLAGYGLREIFEDLDGEKSRVKWFGAILVFGSVMSWWTWETYDGYSLFSAPALLTAFAVGGVTGCMALMVWGYKAGKGFSILSVVLLCVLFVLPHSYHGLHSKTGWEELDTLVLNPAPRADLLARSQTLSSLGYLMPANDFQDRTDFIDQVITTALMNGGQPELIEQHKRGLSEIVGNTTEMERIQQLVSEFFKQVGVTRWLDSPSRVLGVRHSPMPGFYAHADLESLTGPDALTEGRFRELLELMGWRSESGSWAKTMSSKQVTSLDSLLDILNVRYLVSWKQDVNTSHYASNFGIFGETLNTNALADLESADGLQARRILVSQDRVSCTPRGLTPDGEDDIVFVVDMIRDVPGRSADRDVFALRLERKKPKRVFHTGGPHWILGVAAGKDAPLLNDETGRVVISEDPPFDRLWLYACADGADHAGSKYRVRAAYRLKEPLPRVVSLDMTAWERPSAWPRAFFVDEIASYQDTQELITFLDTAAGVPLVAVYGDNSVPPAVDRSVVPAHSYRITENSTSFSIDAPSAGIVALTEVNIPGDVHATVNDQNVEVITVNHVFRGLKLPKAGSYNIKFYYRPKLWFPSLALALIGVTLLSAGVILASRYRRRAVSI